MLGRQNGFEVLRGVLFTLHKLLQNKGLELVQGL